MRLAVLLLLLSASLAGQSRVGWRCLGGASPECPAVPGGNASPDPALWPAHAGQAPAKTDSLGRAVLYMKEPGGSSSIYSTTIYTIDGAAGAETVTRLPGGDGAVTAQNPAGANKCPADSGNIWPADGHPDGQWFPDSHGNAWTIGRVAFSSCTWTVTADGSNTVTASAFPSFPFYHGTGPGTWEGQTVDINSITYNVATVSSDGHTLTVGAPGPTTVPAGTWTLQPDHFGTQGRTSIWQIPLTGGSVGTNTLIGLSGLPAGTPVFTFPAGFVFQNGSSVYDPVHDVGIIHRWNKGSHMLFLWCPGNSVSGPQSTVGCVNPHDFAEPVLSSGTVNVSNSPSTGSVVRQTGTAFNTDGTWVGKNIVFSSSDGSVRVASTIASVADGDHLAVADNLGTLTGYHYSLFPTAVKFMAMDWDSVHQDAVLYGGGNDGLSTFYNETWSYNPATKEFKLLCGKGCTPPPVYTNQSSSGVGLDGLVYRASTNTHFYRASSSATPALYEYERLTDRWTPIQYVTGPISRPGIDMSMTGLGTDRLLAVTRNVDANNTTEIWVGDITPNTGMGHSTLLCHDVDGDGYGSGPQSLGPYTNLVIDGTTNTKVTSASHTFVADDVGRVVTVTSGTGFTVQSVTIVSVAAGAATLEYSAGTLSSTGGHWQIDGCLGPDADDLDAAVHTADQACIKWGGGSCSNEAVNNHAKILKVLNHLGRNPAHIWYVALAGFTPSGNDSTGTMDDTTKPFLTCCGVGKANPAAADDVVIREGSYNTNITLPNGSDRDHQVGALSYPGEKARWNVDGTGFHAQGAIWQFYGGLGCNMCNTNGSGIHDLGTANISPMSINNSHDVVIDGFDSSGNEWGLNGGTFYNYTVFNGVLHDQKQTAPNGGHGLYWANHDGENTSGGVPPEVSTVYSYGTVIRGTHFIRNPEEGIHLNGRFEGAVVDHNIFNLNDKPDGGAAIQLQTGVRNSTFSVLSFLNNSTSIGLDEYAGWCTTDNPTGPCPYGQTGNVFDHITSYNNGHWEDGTLCCGASNSYGIHITLADGLTGSQGNNTFSNSIVVTWRWTPAGATPWTYDANSSSDITTTTLTNVIGYSSYQPPWSTNTFLVGATEHNCAWAAANFGSVTGCNWSDPLFVAADAANYNQSLFDLRLTAGSPAKGTATPNTISIFDLIGNPFSTTAPSIGAYEYMGASSGSISGGPVIMGGKVLR